MTCSRLCGAAIVFGLTVQAAVFGGPKQTEWGAIALDAHYPRPTEPPHFHELKRRATGTTETFLVATDNVCGYVSGLAGAPYSCDAKTELCVFITSSAGLPGAVGCCNDRDCGFRITCYDNAQVSTSSLCTGGCLVDSFTAKCTSGSLTYCNTITFAGGTTDYFCNSLSISTAQEALTTYNGETDGRTLSELVITPTSGQSGLDLSSARATSKQSSSTTSSTPKPTDGGSSGGGGSSTNAGAIAGGVVGGVAVIGIVILGVVFMLRRRGSRPDPPTQQTSYQGQPPPQQPGFSPMMQQQPPAGHQSFYGGPHDPTKMGDQPPFSQTQPTPPLNQYSPQPQYGQAYMAPNQQSHPSALMPGQPYPDRNDAASPLSHTTDPSRISQYGSSPTTSQGYPHMSQQTVPGQQPMQPPRQAVHEAGGNVVGGQTDYNADHRGHMHELA